MEDQPIVSLNEAARTMGRKGGGAKSDAKRAACANNSAMSRGLIARMAKRIYGRNLPANDARICAIKRGLICAVSKLDSQKKSVQGDGMESQGSIT